MLVPPKAVAGPKAAMFVPQNAGLLKYIRIRCPAVFPRYATGWMVAALSGSANFAWDVRYPDISLEVGIYKRHDELQPVPVQQFVWR